MNRTIFIAGESSTGKSSALRNLKDRASYAYFNADDKPLPIGGANVFLTNQRIVEPEEILDYYDQLEAEDRCSGLVLDTITYLMALYERKIVNTAQNGQEAWKNYSIFYKELNDRIKASEKTHIVMGHTNTVLNEQTGMNESKIMVKGSVGKIGVEADYTVIVTTKQMPISKLRAFETPLLTYSPQEEVTGMKYVFNTMVLKTTVGDLTRAPMGFWDVSEQFIDNDIQIVLDRYDQFYK